MRSGFMVLLAVTGLAFAPRIFAQCAGAAQGLAPAKEYALHHGGQEIVLSLCEEQLLLSIKGATASRVSVRQDNSGPPELLIPLAAGLFAVIGLASACLGAA
jgi:hypothetical protein